MNFSQFQLDNPIDSTLSAGPKQTKSIREALSGNGGAQSSTDMAFALVQKSENFTVSLRKAKRQ